MTEVKQEQVSTDAPAPEMPANQQPTGIQIADLQTILQTSERHRPTKH